MIGLIHCIDDTPESIYEVTDLLADGDVQHAAQRGSHVDGGIAGCACRACDGPGVPSAMREFPGDSFDTIYAPVTLATSYIQPA